MPTTASIRLAAREWLALREGPAHNQAVHGRERAACGADRIDPRFAHPRAGRPLCDACLDALGIVVPAPVPTSETELRFAWGDR